MSAELYRGAVGDIEVEASLMTYHDDEVRPGIVFGRLRDDDGLSCMLDPDSAKALGYMLVAAAVRCEREDVNVWPVA